MPLPMVSPFQVVVPASASVALFVSRLADPEPIVPPPLLLTVVVVISPPFQLKPPLTLADPVEVPSMAPDVSVRLPLVEWEPLNFAVPPLINTLAFPFVLLLNVVLPLRS